MSDRKTHNKLVRDRIPEIIDALLIAFDLDREAVLAMQQKRRDERGGFEKRIKLLWTE